MNDGGFILYRSEVRAVNVQLRAIGGSLWLSQAEMASLFGTTPQNITLHIKAVYEEGKLCPESTCTQDAQLRREGRRDVCRTIRIYSLDIILAVSRRVRGPRSSQFRQWVATRLGEPLATDRILVAAPRKDRVMHNKPPFAATIEAAKILCARAEATMPHMELTSSVCISNPSEG